MKNANVCFTQSSLDESMIREKRWKREEKEEGRRKREKSGFGWIEKCMSCSRPPSDPIAARNISPPSKSPWKLLPLALSLSSLCLSSFQPLWPPRFLLHSSLRKFFSDPMKRIRPTNSYLNGLGAMMEKEEDLRIEWWRRLENREVSESWCISCVHVLNFHWCDRRLTSLSTQPLI